MAITCQRCGMAMADGKQHADPGECFDAMRAVLGGVRITMAAARDQIERCRKMGHKPNKPILMSGGTVCRDCLSMGFATFEVMARLVVEGVLPRQTLRLPLRLPVAKSAAPPPPPAAAPAQEGAAP